MTVAVIKAKWTGGPSAPGLSQFAFDASAGTGDLEVRAADVREFLFSFGTIIPDEYQITFDGIAELYNEGTGQLVDEVTYTPPAAVVGGGAGSYAHGVGISVAWRTANIRFGRRVVGRTFIVPLVASAFDASGGIPGATTTAWANNAKTKMVDSSASAGMPFCVWSRPSQAHPVGALSEVTAATVKGKAAWLTGRRD